MGVLIPGAVGAAAKLTAPMVTAPVLTKAAATAGPTLGAVESSVIGSSLAALAPEVFKSLFGVGGAARTPAGATTTGTSGFTITAQDVLALEQFVARENFRRRFLGEMLDTTNPQRHCSTTERTTKSVFVEKWKNCVFKENSPLCLI